MIIWEGAAFPGVLIECRPLGLIKVEQTNRVTGRRERNDRLLVVPLKAPRQDGVRGIDDLGPRVREELELFFKTVVAFEGKNLSLAGWGDAAEAEALVANCAT